MRGTSPSSVYLYWRIVLTSKSNSEMLVLVQSSQVIRTLVQCGQAPDLDAETVGDWARAKVAEHFTVDLEKVRMVSTATATDWLQRIVCPLSSNEARAHTMFAGSLILAKAVRTTQYLSALEDLERGLAGIDFSICFPKPSIENDIAKYGEAFMEALQELLRSRSPEVNQALARPSAVLGSLVRLANIVSGQAYLDTPFLDLRQMRTLPPTIDEIMQRQGTLEEGAPGACYWLIGLAIGKFY